MTRRWFTCPLCPTADAADIKVLWQRAKDAEVQSKLAPRPGLGLMKILNEMTSGAINNAAAWHAMNRLLFLESAHQEGIVLPVTPDGRPTDAVFEAFARIEMKFVVPLPEGSGNTPPYDVAELKRMLAI